MNYSFAQIDSYFLDVKSGCLYNPGEQFNSIKIFKPINTKYLKIAQEIILSRGVKKDVQFYEADINNALATIVNGKMIIIYDTTFLNMTEKLTNNKGGATMVLAHEIGHLLNIHSLAPSASSPWWDELDADYFVGLIVLAKKIPIESIYALYDLFPTMSDSKSHPEWQARIKTTINGYCNGILSNQINSTSRSSDPITRLKQLQHQLSLLLNQSKLDVDYDVTIAFSVSNSVITRAYKNEQGEIFKEELPISDVSSIELLPHDVGTISFSTYSGGSFYWMLGGMHNKEIIDTYNSRGMFIMDDEVSSMEDLEILKKLCSIIGEIKLLSN